MPNPTWVKSGSTWLLEGSVPTLSFSYDLRHQEFEFTLGNDVVYVPLRHMADLLKLAGLEIHQDSEVQRVMTALSELQKDVLDVEIYYEKILHARLTRDRRDDTGRKRSGQKVMGRSTSSIVEQLFEIAETDVKVINSLQSRVKALEQDNAKLKSGMGELITAANKEMAVLKKKLEDNGKT